MPPNLPRRITPAKMPLNISEAELNKIKAEEIEWAYARQQKGLPIPVTIFTLPLDIWSIYEDAERFVINLTLVTAVVCGVWLVMNFGRLVGS